MFEELADAIRFFVKIALGAMVVVPILVLVIIALLIWR